MGFLEDTFTDTDDTELSTHDPDVGDASSWARFDGAEVHQIQSNHVLPITDFSAYANTTTPPSADYEVVAEMTVSSVQPAGNWIAGRVDSVNDDRYEALWWDGGNFYELKRRVGGSSTSLGTYSPGADPSGDSVKLEMIGSAIKVYINGTERISATDSQITDAGEVGLGGDHTDAFLDNLVATDLGAAPAGDPAGRRYYDHLLAGAA